MTKKSHLTQIIMILPFEFVAHGSGFTLSFTCNVLVF
jgi:hypothetical protein